MSARRARASRAIATPPHIRAASRGRGSDGGHQSQVRVPVGDARAFVFSLAGHWGFGWCSYKDEARQHGQEPSVGAYAVEMSRDTLENWQSEFLQLIWQVAGLSPFWYVGSPQSKDSEDRLEERVDFLLALAPGGEARRKELDTRFVRR